ncbi:unnamed protein product [Cuscuta epithymum]|uniref:Uncharacterized protein n=1 Tax=Cuscuta epithymum TaxID=186058 RepID=A0AAV0DCI6_9ASTE|nr:unnamed protein product [Cuscuta epithymum]
MQLLAEARSCGPMGSFPLLFSRRDAQVTDDAHEYSVEPVFGRGPAIPDCLAEAGILAVGAPLGRPSFGSLLYTSAEAGPMRCGRRCMLPKRVPAEVALTEAVAYAVSGR